MRLIDPATRLVLNPELARLPGADRAVCVRDDIDRVLPLSDAAWALLAGFARPARVREALSNPSEQELRAIATLLDLRVLLAEGELPRTTAVSRRPAAACFANVPRWDEETAGDSAMVILGVEFDGNTLPSYPRGTARGPDFVRAASRGFSFQLGLADGEVLGLHDIDEGRPMLRGARLFDAGNVAPEPAATWHDVAARVERELREIRRRGAVAILLGGDHSLTLPAVRAIDEPAFGILHIDAHTDLAPVRFQGDVHHGNVMQHVAALPSVKHILQIGHRGINPAAPVVSETSYTCVSVSRIRDLSAAEREALCIDGLPYYVSVDVDGLDPSVAPGTPVPTPGGLHLAETRAILREITRGRRLCGADLVEVLPDADRPAITGYTAVQLVLQIMDCMKEMP